MRQDVKVSHMSIRRILSLKDKNCLNLRHPLQRMSGQWGVKDKSALISDILQDNPIDYLKFGIENVNSVPITWVLDGVQRISTLGEYRDNIFAISKSIEKYMIEYVALLLDEDGVQRYDEFGKPMGEIRSFDIRGKRFKQLPKELQEIFLDYSFDIITHADSSSQSISYHLKRYNAGKPMNAAQKGFTYIGDRWGNTVRSIAQMDFFSDGIGKYTPNDLTKGNVERVIVESVMTTRFLKEYRKNFVDNNKFLEKHAIADDFEYFRGLVEQLAENVDDSVGQMFDKKNSFLWFGLYSKFITFGLDDEQFNTFMLQLNKDMHHKDENGKTIKDAPMTGICVKEIDGATFEEVWKNASTKDVNVVKTRIDFLTKLACDYFCVEMIEDVEETASVKAEDVEKVIHGVIDEANNELVINDEELQEFVEEFSDVFGNVNEKIAISSLMMTTNGHGLKAFDDDSLKNMVEWYKLTGNKAMLDDCLSYKSFADDAGIDGDNPNMPLFIWGAKYAFDKMDTDIEFDVDITEWLRDFPQTAFCEIESFMGYPPYDSNIIQMKKSEIASNLREYIGE